MKKPKHNDVSLIRYIDQTDIIQVRFPPVRCSIMTCSESATIKSPPFKFIHLAKLGLVVIGRMRSSANKGTTGSLMHP